MISVQRILNPKAAITVGAAVAAGLVGKRVLQREPGADLSGEVAVVTGASSGLGYLIAREFGREGCKLVICARDSDALESARTQLLDDGVEVLAVKCDVSDQEQVDQLITQATERFGKIDILVNNAGVIQFGPMQSTTRENFENAMDTMFWGTVQPTLAVLPQMTERGHGRIVNITSIGGKVSVPHLLPYNSAKFAALGFSEGLHAEVGKDGIAVTTIVPGLMRTGSFVNAQFVGDVEKEYTWFSLGSSLPLITIDAESAARQIVEATRRGESERIISLPAKILARIHGVAPATTARILSAVDKWILPDPPDDPEHNVPGKDLQERIDSNAQEAATTLGREAAQQYQPADNLPPGLRSDYRD
ncbi:MAG: SDR family NAD(P)-dependent oxidoreductase [Sphaerobacteraceae bacterium]|nr:MAG: SDR family NAD(P)-dependent oxidoreductase [Sphaerobacteraceae bacterium]